MNTIRKISYLIVLILFFSTEKLKSDDAIMNFSQINPAFNVTFSNSAGGFNLGYKFTALEALTVTALGYYADPTLSSFLNDHPVALYDLNGNILATTIVTNASPLTGLFRFNSIVPLTLNVGESYVLGGVTGYSADNAPVDKYTHDPLDLTIDPRIAFVENREMNNTQNNLVFPTFVEISVDPPLQFGWFGPNLLVVSVPEPGTLIILGGGLALALRNRFRKSSKPVLRSESRKLG